jgi:hypothetical protein
VEPGLAQRPHLVFEAGVGADGEDPTLVFVAGYRCVGVVGVADFDVELGESCKGPVESF